MNLLALTILLLSVLSQESVVVTSTTINKLSPAALDSGKIQIITDGISSTDCSVGGGSNTVFCRSNGSAWAALQIGNGGGGSSVPSGAILIINSGSCPVGYTEVSSFNGKTLLGTLAANGDIGSTGGSDTLTPVGTISQPVFTGDPITDILNHTHGISINDPGHGHLTQRYPTATGGSSGFTIDTSMSGTPANNTLPVASSATGVTASSANPSGGVASIIPSGIVSIPLFTGTQFDNRSAFIRCVFCRKD